MKIDQKFQQSIKSLVLLFIRYENVYNNKMKVIHDNNNNNNANEKGQFEEFMRRF